MGRLNPRHKTKIQGKNGNRERGIIETSQRGESYWRADGDGETEQSGASYDEAKREIEHVRVERRS